MFQIVQFKTNKAHQYGKDEEQNSCQQYMLVCVSDQWEGTVPLTYLAVFRAS